MNSLLEFDNATLTAVGRVAKIYIINYCNEYYNNDDDDDDDRANDQKKGKSTSPLLASLTFAS